MDNMEEMGKFLEKYNLPKLDQEEMGILFALAPSLYSFWSYFSTDLH